MIFTAALECFHLSKLFSVKYSLFLVFTPNCPILFVSIDMYIKLEYDDDKERETHPMLFVNVLVSVPLARQERMLFTYDLPVKKGHLDKRKIISSRCYSEG